MTSTKSNVETEFININKKKAWSILYQHIQQKCLKYDFKYTEALKPQNKSLNRYRDVNPYDQSRIVLSRGPCDYINANIVKVDRANRRYILTQGPLISTVGHFWLMVWEQRTIAVLMLNKLVEKRQVKCHCYWPDEMRPENALILKDVGLKLEYIEYQNHSYYSKRIFRLTDTESDESREIMQFHYTTWPDFGVPSSPTAFLEFLRDVRASGALEENVGPAVVHCSAGIGRSGTFCLVDSCLILIEKFGLNSIDIKEILLEMRQYRMGLIQTPDQLRFSYQAIIEGAKPLSGNDAEDSNSENAYDDETLEDEEEIDEPPPLPTRAESLIRSQEPLFDRPLPKIPNSTSLNEITFNDKTNSDIVNSNMLEDKTHNSNNCICDPPDRPLPVVPQDEESDEDHEINNLSGTPESSPEKIIENRSLSPTEIRQRNRQERNEVLAARVNNIKRKQRSAEQWANIKRSLYTPVTLGICIAFLLGGGAVAYAYFRG